MRPRPTLWLAAVPLVLFFGEFLYAFVARVAYPWGLEWMEGDLLVAAHRLAWGDALYSRPEEWVPYFYPPLYMILWAPLVQAFGPVFWTGRLLSAVASAGTSLALFGYVRRRTGRSEAGLVAAGLFWGFYQYTGQWLDLCRVDPLMLFLVAAGLYYYQRGRTRPGARAPAVVLLGSALLAKQNAGAFLLAVGLAEFLDLHRLRAGGRSPARYLIDLLYSARFLIAGAALSACWLALAELLTHGWYWDYAYAMPARLGQRNLFGLIFLRPTVKYALPVVLGLVAWIIWGFLSRRWKERRLELLLLAFGVSASLPVAFKYGAYYNNLLPMMLALCVAGGVALGDALNATAQHRSMRLAVLALALAQVLVLFAFNRPGQWRPNRIPAAEANFTAAIDSLPRPLWIMSHPYLNLRQGEPVYVKPFAALEYHETMGALPEVWIENVRRQRYAAIVADYPLDDRFDLFAEVVRAYRPAGEIAYGDEALPERRRALMPRSGSPTRPTYIWVPR